MEVERIESCWEREKQGKRVGGGEKSIKSWERIERSERVEVELREEKAWRGKRKR